MSFGQAGYKERYYKTKLGVSWLTIFEAPGLRSPLLYFFTICTSLIPLVFTFTLLWASTVFFVFRGFTMSLPLPFTFFTSSSFPSSRPTPNPCSWTVTLENPSRWFRPIFKACNGSWRITTKGTGEGSTSVRKGLNCSINLRKLSVLFEQKWSPKFGGGRCVVWKGCRMG